MPHEPPPAEATEEQMCQARKMEVVGQLAGGIVHDFNNILTVITGTIDILAEAVADRPELAAIAGLIDQAAARGADLTAHLLAFARGQPSRPREVDVNLLLVDAARLLRPTLGEQIEIASMRASDVPLAWVDPHRLMTAVLNLAINARDAMPRGGKLTFSTGNAANAHSKIAAGDDVMMAVGASGYGISAGFPERTFPGLGMVRDFVGQSGGHIEVRGEARDGATVEIYLPRPPAAVQPPAEDSSQPPMARGDEAILIVENDALVRQSVVTQVQSLGYRTLAASNADQALAIIDSGEAIDLLFTDVIMPGSINGRQLAIEALNRRPSLRVLYTSGYTADAMVHEGCPDPGVLLLAKPYRKTDLAKMIRAALAA